MSLSSIDQPGKAPGRSFLANKRRWKPTLSPEVFKAISTGGCVFVCCWLFVLLEQAGAQLSVETNFEGGSARVLSIDQATRTVRFMPAGDPLRGWPCWWSLRIDGTRIDETITLEVVASDRVTDLPNAKPLAVNWSTPTSAAVSHDGQSWIHSEPGVKRDRGFAWRLTARGSQIWVAWGPPFTLQTANALGYRLAENSFVTRFVLAKTREGREVPGLHIREGSIDSSDRFGIWIQARQHAWESGGSWVCQGVAEWLCSEDELAQWLRQHSDITIVPVMDVDHVITGDGGKGAVPQDHNRDWTESPHWPEVAAAQKRILGLVAQQRLTMFLDLHNPAPGDLQSFFFTGEDSLMPDPMRARRDRFLGIAAELLDGPIPHSPKARPSGSSYDPLWRQISNNWVATHANSQTVAVCLETSWNTPGSTISGYRRKGANLGEAIATFLRDDSVAETARPAR